jgi:hypothetical protein
MPLGHVRVAGMSRSTTPVLGRDICATVALMAQARQTEKLTQDHHAEADLSRLALPLVGGIPLYRGDVDADIRVVARHHLAEDITAGLSWPSKMPGPAWGISAGRCKAGSRLAEEEGTTCSECYATKGRYSFDKVQDKLEKRYEGLFHPLWVPAMTFLIRWHAEEHFRWFDSGDLQDESHLLNICKVAEHTPDVRHWLPTREYDVVRACKDHLPENLLVRVSATMIDGIPPTWWPQTSTVISSEEWMPGVCGAPETEGRCTDCRACWDPEVGNVAYRLH